ncbi:MAG TPA: nicotinate (nicotinamide) nucleotide adenylyltransferase [Bacteroidales bacterium]|nr:nicotinate (nicotinamide) nucleotide adenylyltransferase [Bacteroidales bacterium]
MNIGLFFGSFNPIHIGHLAIANYIVEFGDLDEIWLIVSPHNPLKKEETLLDETQRLKMVQLALSDNSKIKPSTVEFNLPKPSYTIDTLNYLSDKYPDKQFKIILGTDNFKSFHQWKNYKKILANYDILVYPRAGYDIGEYKNYPNISLIDAPLMEISSSFIRKSLQIGKNVQYFLPCGISDYIKTNHLYKK